MNMTILEHQLNIIMKARTKVGACLTIEKNTKMKKYIYYKDKNHLKLTRSFRNNKWLFRSKSRNKQKLGA